MNIYVVVEGRAEKIVYSSWIPSLNPLLSEVSYVEELNGNKFLIREGGGMPQYFDVIAAAVEDARAFPEISRLVVCVDSEDQSFDEKYAEVTTFIAGCNPNSTTDTRVVVQDFCFEVWALANRRAMPTTVREPRLLTFKKHFDVSVRDPELLSPLPESEFNRAQTAKSYLRSMISTKWKREKLGYSEGNPGPVVHPSYFRHVRARRTDTKHIARLDAFIDAFG